MGNFSSFSLGVAFSLSLQGIGSYPGAAPGYPGPPHPFSSAGQYPPYGGSQSAAAMAAAAAAAAAAGHPGHPGLMQQQQQALSGRHRFTPPTEGASSGSRQDMSSSGHVDGASYPVSSRHAVL